MKIIFIIINVQQKSCKALITYEITDACKGMYALCEERCPVEAITGEVKGKHVIDQDKCIKCGKCAELQNLALLRSSREEEIQ